MISDEMRELLSTYVDDELTHNDAVRVEDMSKRDPELRREIEAYRVLRRQLKAWDAADNDVTPPPTLRARALERARAYVDATGLKTTRTFGGVWALAAGLLLAAGLGVMLAGGGEQRPVHVHASNVLPPQEWTPYETPGRHDTVVSLKELKPLPEYAPVYKRFKDGLKYWIVDGRRWTRNSLTLGTKWAEERDQLVRWKQKHPEVREARTGAWRAEIMAVVRGYAAASVPLEGLVIFRHQVGVDAPEVVAMPTGADVADDKYEANRLLIDTSKLERGRSRLLLAGELFVGSKDKSNRVRIVTASSWVRDSSMVPMVWGDRVNTPRIASRLVLQSEMLGPEARRAIVRGQALPKGTMTAMRSGRKTRAIDVARLMNSLRLDAGATGFAVVADKNVLGVELFATHELMLAFASRLLHGYLAEAGTDAIRLVAPTRGHERIQKLARKLMDKVSQNALKLSDLTGGTNDEWPKGLRRVNIMAGPTAVVGHGLLLNGRPLHMTLFGD